MSVRDLVESFYEDLWNRQDQSRLGQILAEDFRFRGSLGLEKSGPDQFWEYVEYIVGPLGDYRCDIQEIVVEGDRAFAKMWFSGVHRGEMLGIPPSGRRIGWAGAALFRAEGDRLAELWVLGDLVGLEASLKGTA
jgi:predicted ester cyclase